MPTHKSAKKRVRTSLKANQRNRSARSRLTTAIKSLLETKDQASAETAFRAAVSTLDKSVKSGLIHANNAANKKSRLSKHVIAVSKAK